VIALNKATLPETTPETSTRPTVMPTMPELRKLLVCNWKPGHRLSFVEHCQGRTGFWDVFVNGLRPREDVKRCKESRTHRFSNADGWIATKYEGGRCKLTGEKKGNRQWWLFTPCCCLDSKHVAPTLDDRYSIGPDGNPLAGFSVGFNPVCPMACIQFVNLWLTPAKRRRYPNWKSNGGFGVRNVKDVAGKAVAWALANGVGDPEAPFDTNGGRHCLARWLSNLKVWFEEGFEIHADHPETWPTYQPDCRMKNAAFSRRTQSEHPDIALRALRKLVTWLGVAGEPYQPQLTRAEEMQRATMEHLGMGNTAKRICLGFK